MNGIVAEIKYSLTAEMDLEQIGDYIAETLKSPIAALHTVNKIQDAVVMLADFPLMGAPLSSITDIDTDYRFLVCGSYLVFYHFLTEDVFIDRILYGRRDYVSILFKGIAKDDFEF